MLRNPMILIAVVLLFCACQEDQPDSISNDKYIIAYFFPQDRIISENELAVEKLTHINYAFADIKDGEILKGFKYDSENFKILNQMKSRNPSLKILISIGGWTWSGQFSDMSLTKESRKKFIESSIKFMEKHKLDGIDLDWEFPNLVGYGNVHRPEDKENFTLLLKEFRDALDKYGDKVDQYYLLTIASGAFDDYLANTEMGKASQYLDFLNVMAYDLYESGYDSIAGHHAPLFTNPKDPRQNSASSSIEKYIKDGVPPGKIVLGVPFYGRSWESHSSVDNGLYEKGGPTTKRIRTSFKYLKPDLENKNGFIRYWDSTSSVPFLYNEVESIFVTYEDEESLKAKCKYIKENNLKGAMFWEYQSDYQLRLVQTLYDELK